MSYESLHRDLYSAAERARDSIDHQPGDHNDAGQALQHLDTLINMLDEIDASSPEEPSAAADLAKAVAQARDVLDHQDYFDGDLEALAAAVAAAEDAGFIAPTPLNEWYNGDTPPNGEN
ncbi:MULTISPECIES: hypothetical protein [Microbacterium]|uniref:hypothetical protein n=1 Tax=Microbacterium TaxID=33882 RepID=UPI002AC5CE84|nr:hypothetical protein [Microbacterium testaceum]MDZ5145310.1 hypothetical protein [Microbacterium testaceum]